MAEWYEILIPIAALITACVALISIYFIRKQLKMTEKAYNSSKNAAEIDAFLNLQQSFSLNDNLTKVRTVISTKGPILNNEGGTIDYKDFATYLDVVNRFVYYSRKGVIDEVNIVAVFGPAAIEIEENPYVMKYIQNHKEKHGTRMFEGISELAKKSKEATGYDLINNHYLSLHT